MLERFHTSHLESYHNEALKIEQVVSSYEPSYSKPFYFSNETESCLSAKKKKKKKKFLTN